MGKWPKISIYECKDFLPVISYVPIKSSESSKMFRMFSFELSSILTCLYFISFLQLKWLSQLHVRFKTNLMLLLSSTCSFSASLELPRKRKGSMFVTGILSNSIVVSILSFDACSDKSDPILSLQISLDFSALFSTKLS